MSDLFSASVDSADSADLIALFDRLAQSADFVCREVALDTAKRIVAEAQRRVRRASGATAEGIHFELSHDGTGYVVLMGDAVSSGETTRRQRLGMKSQKSVLYQVPHTGIYLEFGTAHQYARPFFFSSAQLEEGPHLRRLTERIQAWLESVGR